MGHRRKVLNAKRNAAKIGMGGSMATLVYTGFKRGRRYMNIHTWAGMALLGFTLWHIALYRPRILAGKSKAVSATRGRRRATSAGSGGKVQAKLPNSVRAASN